MTKVEDLDENLTPQLEDWLPIQSPGQKIKKVKIDNLPIQSDTSALEAEINSLQTALDSKVESSTLANTVSALQLVIDQKLPSTYQPAIFSSQQPSNPTQGMIWGELDNNNNLIEIWYRLNNLWVSSVKKNILQFQNTFFSTWFALDSRFIYLFKQLLLTLISTTELTPTNFSRIDYLVRRGAANIGGSNYTFNNGLANTAISQAISMNSLITAQSGDWYYLNATRPANTTIQVMAALDYQLIRK